MKLKKNLKKFACVAAFSLAPAAGFACSKGECPPVIAQDAAVGDRIINTTFKPKICLGERVDDLMTVAIDNSGRKFRVTVAKWGYIFWHQERNPPYYPNQRLINGQCMDDQSMVPETVVMNWFNCLNRETGQWERYWSSTRPVVDNGRYELTIYYTEQIDGPNSVPSSDRRKWPLPPRR